MRSLVSSGHLICTKCTSAAEAMPASFMAARHGLGGRLDLRRAADLLGLEGARQADADGEPRPGRRGGRRLAAEHQQMRRQPAFGAARHDDGDALLDLGHRAFQALGQQQLQRQGGVAAGEIVDAAIALGLADDGDDGRGIDLAAVDGGGERRGVARARRRPAAARAARRGHGHAALPASLPWRSRRRRTQVKETSASAITRNDTPVVTVPSA